MKRMLTVYSSQESDKDWTWPLHWVILLPRGSTGPQESSRLGDALPSWVNTSHKSSSVRKTTGSHTSVHVAKYQLHQQPWKASKCNYILVTWLEKKIHSRKPRIHCYAFKKDNSWVSCCRSDHYPDSTSPPWVCQLPDDGPHLRLREPAKI